MKTQKETNYIQKKTKQEIAEKQCCKTQAAFYCNTVSKKEKQQLKKKI
jgi:hypothetical protein